MSSEKQDERHEWVLVPALLAAGGVLGVQIAYSVGRLGSQYNATIVWDDWQAEQWNHTTCEHEQADAFVRRPISAVCSFFYFLVGLIIIVRTMIDMARSPSFRNLLVLMERELFWGPILAAGPVTLCGVTFLAFASSREFLFVLIHFTWWVTMLNFAAYAWARLIQEARFQNECCARCPGAADLSNYPDDDTSDNGENGKTGLKEVLFSIVSIICIAASAALSFLLYAVRREVLENQAQELLVFLLILITVIPVFIHWRIQREKVYIRWWRLCLVAILGLGSYALLVGDSTLSLCRNATSFAQPFAGFELVSATALLVTYLFFRGDRHQAKYIVIVQADHRLDDTGAVSAFYVPEDDPYRGSRKVANAVPAESEAPGVTNSRSIRAESSGSNASARRSSAQVQQPRASIQEIAFDRGSSPARRPGSRVENDSAIFGASTRLEGSTMSHDSAGGRARGSQQNQLRPRPPGVLNRDSSVDLDPSRSNRPRSLDRRIYVEGDERSSSDRRLSSAGDPLDPRARVPSVDRRLEPRPSRVAPEQTLNSFGSARSISSNRGSNVLSQPGSAPAPQYRATSLDRGFIVGAPGSEPGRSSLIGNQRPGGGSGSAGRPLSGSVEYAPGPILYSVPVQSRAVGSGSSAASFSERPRPPSLTLDQIENGVVSRYYTPAGGKEEVPVIVARSRVSLSQAEPVSPATPSTDGRPKPPVPATPPAAPAFGNPQTNRIPASVGVGVPAIPRTSQVRTETSDGIPVIRSSQRPSATATRGGSVVGGVSPSPRPSATDPNLIAAATPTGRLSSVQSTPVPVTPPPGLGFANPPRRATVEPASGRPSLTVDAGQSSMKPMSVEERRPVAGSFDSTGGGRPMAGSIDSVTSARRPGRPRRSSVDRDNNPAMRAMNAGRSVERERERSGQQLDPRKVQLRSPEEAIEATRRLSVGTFDDDGESPPPQAQLSTAERLALLRAERARLEQERMTLQQRRNTKQ